MEAYYCVVDYVKEQETAKQSQIYVKTLDGDAGLYYGMETWGQISPDGTLIYAITIAFEKHSIV